MNVGSLEARLSEQGWVAFGLPDPSAIFETRDFLLAKLRETLRRLDRLEDYHRHVSDEQSHVAVMFDLANAYWKSGISRGIVARNLDLFRRLVAADLIVQPTPYLRSVRPGVASDAVPLHRDTYYGGSPYEVSVVVPLTRMEASQTVRVISGSHLLPDSNYPHTRAAASGVEFRSPKHQLGYPYAPKLLDPKLMDEARPVPLDVGEVLLFPLQLVHGGGTNSGGGTRFSTDIRLANLLAPVEWSRGVRREYFVPLCTSAVTRAAQAYLAANAQGSERSEE